MLGKAIQQAWRIHLCGTEPVCGTGASLQGESKGSVGAWKVRGPAGGLNMDAPIFDPHLWIGLPATGFKLPAHVLTEPRLQVRQMHEVIGLADAHDLAAKIKAGPRNQEMQVGMKLHALVPGMQYGGKPADVRPQSLGGSKLLGQRMRARGKEHVVGLLGERAEEAPAQFVWERKGDQEVGRAHEFAQLAVDPRGGGLASALRAGFVIAGMECEVDLAASFARKAAPAQCRGAAMSDRPDGAPWLLGERRV
jgi:hypothetical protein